VDWLWVVEALAGELQRDTRREVIRFIDEPRQPSARGSGTDTELAQTFDAIFQDLSDRLSDIAAKVARRHEVAAYYECCDKMHAAYVDGGIVEDDGGAHRFNRYEFRDGGWVDLRDGAYWDDPAARSPLGPIGEVLVHTPLARVSFCFVDFEESALKNADLPGEWASLELDIHLAIRPDVEDPRQAGALLIHPFVAVYDKEIQHTPEKKDARWWSSWPQVALDHVDERWVAVLSEAIRPPSDQHMERAAAITRSHLGEARLIPLSGEACQTWLSFGANSSAPDFGEYFWHDTAAAALHAADVVSAPAGTLAGFVQYNLLMAAETGNRESRIDQALDRDAKSKVTALKRLLDTKRREFQLRMSSAKLGEAD
jgi:hypothetical protein